MLEIEGNSKLKLKLFGKEFEIEAPSTRKLDQVQKAVKAASESKSDTLEPWIAFLAELGIDRELVERLELKKLEMVIDYVTGIKKN